MTSIGETLRRERQRRNLDLDQVSRELKIAPRFLEAIEAEQFDRLPGGVFAKSFVRQYARMMHIDEEEAAAEVQRTIGPPEMPKLAESAAPKTAAPQIEFSPRVDSISGRSLGSGSWLPALALVVAVMLGCSLVYGWWQRGHRLVSAASPKVPTRVVATEASTSTAQVPPAVAESAPAPQQQALAETQPNTAAIPPVTATASSVPTGSQPALRPSGAVKVEITTADEPVWVLARADGKYAFSGTLEPKQTRTVDADGIVLLRLGNAGGVQITVNGKALPELGPKGQVRTVQLTSGGFQIVAPKPSAPPDVPL